MMIRIYENEADIENAYNALMSEAVNWRVKLYMEDYMEVSRNSSPLIAVAAEDDVAADALVRKAFELINEKVGSRAKKFIFAWACSNRYPLSANIAKGLTAVVNEQDEDADLLWGIYETGEADAPSKAMVFAFGE